ncbi:MAG: hypothetical protein LHW59_05340 [Candidatus Cloacimonetes bacterium]|nr:hypothetical protein [Candidatus Cloacimonadota bacterium]
MEKLNREEIEHRLQEIGYTIDFDTCFVEDSERNVVICFGDYDDKEEYIAVMKELNHQIRGIQTEDEDYLMDDDDLEYLKNEYLPELLAIKKALEG